jgi:hypothetical protein
MTSPVGELAPISIAAGSGALNVQIGTAPLNVDHLPIVVGRMPAADEAAAPRHPDLVLVDRQPYRLSRDHFMILRRSGGLFVSHLGSTLGTIVNGQGIGHHFMRDAAPLHNGENRIVAGGWGSPFEFLLSVGQSE